MIETSSTTKHPKQGEVPVTRVGDEGTAKRNIIRKSGGGAGGGTGKSKTKLLDDGSMYQDPHALDDRDPNYDSEDDFKEREIPGSPKRFNYASEKRSAIPQAPLTLTNYKRKLEAIFEELFRCGDIEESQQNVYELQCPQYTYELVKRAISMSLDRSDKEREIVSKFISYSYPNLLSTNMIGKGFERLFEIMDELVKDVPLAHDYIATFIARCVVDEVLPPSFLSDIVVCNLGGEVVEKAKRMLSREHGRAILERGWGPGDGRPVEELKVTVDLLLGEYLLSGDMNEAQRCIRELNSPFFHHEIVKRGVTVSLDKSVESKLLMSGLFNYLYKNEAISRQQFKQGFDRLYTLADDISLDNPNALNLIGEFKQRAISDGILLME